MGDYITIYDDDDVQLIKQVVNLEPIVIDLTDDDEDQPQTPEEAPTLQDPPPAPEEPPIFQHPAPAPEEPPIFQDPPETVEEPSILQDPPQTVEEPPILQDPPQAAKEPPILQVPPSNQQKSYVQQSLKPQMSDNDLMMAQKALGNEKYKRNLFDDAIRTYKRANELAKKLENKEMSAILHFNLAMTYYKLGSFEQAADECANAVKIDDKYMKAHLKRAEIYQRLCKFEEAVICYEHICELDSNNQDYAVLLWHAKEAAKKTKKRDCFQILGLNPNFTHEDLKKAYRQQALSHHPDRHSDADIVTRRIEEKYFKDASEAHTFIQIRYGYKR